MTAIEQRARLTSLDTWRGVAVVLMVLDHVLVLVASAYGSTQLEHLVRVTVTRASLPLFGLLAGMSLYLFERSRRSTLQLLAGGFVCALVGYLLPFGTGRPDVLWIFALVLVVAGPCIKAAPILWGALGVIQVFTWPMPDWFYPWTGYQPGAIVALVALGVLACREPSAVRFFQTGYRLPTVLATIGRRPVEWYVGHFVVLTVVGLFVL